MNQQEVKDRLNSVKDWADLFNPQHGRYLLYRDFLQALSRSSDLPKKYKDLVALVLQAEAIVKSKKD